jgi:site-specific DNA recombinase
MTHSVGIYTRISSDRTGQQTATGRQEEACRAFASLRGWEVEAVYEDIDVSAYQLKERRPAYESMLSALASGDIDGVLCWKLDRLVRRPAEFERFWSVCEKGDAVLASVTEPIDTSSELGLALVRILVTFASLESATMAMRMRAKQRQMAEEGRAPLSSGKPFGLSPDWSVIVPEEAALIREAAGRVVAGDSLYGIAADWRKRGLRSPKGGEWKPVVLRTILNSRRLTGDREYHGEVVATGCFPAILDPVVAAQVRSILADPSRRRSPTRSPHVLTGLLRCGACGGRMRGSVRSSVERDSKAYGCARPPSGCGRVSMLAEPLEEWVTRLVFRRLERRVERVGLTAVSRTDDDALVAAIDENTRSSIVLARDYYVAHRISREEFFACRTGLAHDLEETKRALVPNWRGESLGGPLSPKKLRVEWPSFNTERQRQILATELDHAIIHPALRGACVDLTRVEPVWWDDLGPDPQGEVQTPVGAWRAPPLKAARADPAGRWLSVEQVRRSLGNIGRRVLYDIIREGQLPATRKGTALRIRRGDLARYVERSRIQPGHLGKSCRRWYPEAPERTRRDR